MKQFKDGVKWYTTGTITTEIHFPEDDVCCGWCRYCHSDDSLRRHYCTKLRQMIYNPIDGVLPECPIQFEKKEE